MSGLSRNRITAFFFLALAGLATYLAFDTHFIKVTIDYLSFIAGMFLITEGAYKLSKSQTKTRYDQTARSLRVFIGLGVFGIHLLQFLRHRVLSSEIAEITIDYKDYFALTAGIFLIADALYRISTSKATLFPEQLSRVFRVIIGAILVAIHIMQFMHVYGP
jgi:general stress protein CsbA